MVMSTKIIFVVPLLAMSIIFSSSFSVKSSSNPIVLQGYYVSILGDDNNTGDFEHPWRTIQKAAYSTNAGDTVYVRGGIYYEEVIIKNKQGNQNAWITFKPYNNEEAVVDGRYLSNISYHSIFKTKNSSYIHITGLKVYNSANRGFFLGTASDWILIDYNKIFNCSSNGIIASLNTTNLSVQHNVVDWVNNNWSGNGKWDEGVSFAGVKHFDIGYNKISRCGKECIDVKYGCEYGSVHHNVINTSTWPGDPGYFVNGAYNNYNHIGIYCDGWTMRNYYLDFYNNYIYGDHGSGISCGAERPTGSIDHIRIFNNIINVTYGAPIGVTNMGRIKGESASNISIFSNTAIASSPTCWALNLGADNITGDIRIENNIFVTRFCHIVIRIWYYPPNDKIILNNNLFYSYSGTFRNLWNGTPNLSWGENAILTDPLLEPDFSLNSESPVINNGTMVPISYDFHGNTRDMTYDIGACAFYNVSYEMKRAFIFGRYTNLTIEDGFITVEALHLWILQFGPFKFELYTPPAKITFSDDYVGLKTKRFIIGVFDIVE